jgi:hypothetical protein
MRHKRIVLFLFIGVALAGIARQPLTEAPAGFTTPTQGLAIGPDGELIGMPGSQSVSNGIAEPPVIRSLSIRHSLNADTIPVQVSVRCSMRRPAPNVIRTS